MATPEIVCYSFGAVNRGPNCRVGDMRWFRTGRSRSKYVAFVSYRHADRHWADWLIETFGSFETPDELVGQEVPSRIGKIFRDDKEMSAKADLMGHLKGELWASEHLIVICSKETPASDWVRAEIALFRHWGRADRIHALVIDPDAKRAFPAELRYWRVAGRGPQAVMEMDEAAASVAPVKGKSETELKELARDKLAAALLPCDFGALRKAHLERDRVQTSFRYFEQMISRRGIPEGVGEVSVADIQHRESTLRFENDDGQVYRITRINGHGLPSDNSEGVARWDVAYRGDSSVETIEMFNRSGIPSFRQSFKRDGTQVDFATETDTALAQGFTATAFSFGLVEREGRGKSDVVRHLIDYDENGFVKSRLYARDSYNSRRKMFSETSAKLMSAMSEASLSAHGS